MKSSSSSENTKSSSKRNSITIPLPSKVSSTHLLVGLLVVSSFLLGMLTTRLTYLEGSKTTTQPVVQADTTAQAAAPEDNSPKEVSVDDDPVLGDPNAPVTLVEFSDYECPFCKQHFTNTYKQLKEEYIDTGKVKLVFRDLPLSFHDPMATKEAIAASCAREQGGDETYFRMHDAMFTQTTSNGNGLSVDKLYAIAGELGLNADNFKTCLDSDKYKDEVQKDIQSAGSVGASATPSFFIGKSGSGDTFTGTPLIGAQPYEQFKALIDQNL